MQVQTGKILRIRNDNPDKGTETIKNLASKKHRRHMIRNDNPDKGTETLNTSTRSGVFLKYSVD